MPTKWTVAAIVNTVDQHDLGLNGENYFMITLKPNYLETI